MDIKDKIELVKANIWKAIDDYKAHTKQTEVLDDITDTFVGNLAEDNISAKRELRELFRTSPAWNEDLDALVINGTRTHNPDYDRVNELAEDILAPARAYADNETYETISRAIRFFTKPKSTREERQESIEAIQSLAPNAYAPNKKHSRIFKALCDALKVSDDAAGSKFQRKYAQFADEITSRKIPFKLYVSLSAAHFLTMSNPKADRRGDMMTSCHSLNSTQYEYNCGCTGYGRDEFTFIVFTATDPDDPSTLNSRKNSRQIFAYKPGNGLLLQSRLYNTFGGTCGAQEDSKLYRDLVQREISELEEAANLWRTYNYFGNNHCTIPSGIGFGGYPDWTYKQFAAKISIRSDHRDDFTPFSVGTYGLCIVCGDETSRGLYCESCKPADECDSDDDDEEDDDDDNINLICERCGNTCEETYLVRNDNNQEMYVCDDCRNAYYTCCDDCEAYYPDRQMTEVHNGGQVCRSCLENRYTRCSQCGGYYPNADVFEVYHHGESVQVCDDCRCEHYAECANCGGHFHKDDMKDGLCPNCAAETERDVA